MAESPRDANPETPRSTSATELVTAPELPTRSGNTWAYFQGTLDIAADNAYDPHGVDFEWAYSVRKPLPQKPRIVVSMHGSGGGFAAIHSPFAPRGMGDIELRNQDGEAKDAAWREWWAFSRDGVPYPGRRIALTLEFLAKQFPSADVDGQGLVLIGNSMGGTGSVVQTMILPEPWRARIAYATGALGVILPRRVNQRNPGQFSRWPADTGPGSVWDTIDFALQARNDPIVRGMHYRHLFSTDDSFSAGPDGNTQLEFVNIVEAQHIGGAFFWIRNGHRTSETGVKVPNIIGFGVPEQDVTLDRAHPAITHSTGNHPRLASQRADSATYPRGHYNLGISWHHAGIIDRPDELVFPLKYVRHTQLGGGIPDQPESITVSVTPRRTRHFPITDGATLTWEWDGGALSGRATVAGDTVTIDGIPLQDGDDYKRLRITR